MIKTLAIFSPNLNAYSETFIQAHKNLPFKIKFYHDGLLPRRLEGSDSLINFSLKERIEKKLKKRFTLDQYGLLFSLKREKVECVLAEYGPTACETLEVVKYLKLPMIVHFHGHDSTVHWIINKYQNLYKEVFAYAEYIIAVSVKMGATLVSLGCPEEKICICTYGPNNIFFQNQPEYTTSQFVSVGRFIEKKAPFLTILAFKKVFEQRREAKLLMVGEGELLAACKKLAYALGLSKNIDFLGKKSTEEIRAIFESCIAFVQHSIAAEDGDSEGTPVAILEAQAAALPVIATYHEGIPDVVLNNNTGLLCHEGDIDGMASNMLELLNDNQKVKLMGASARSRILTNFTLDKHLQSIEGLLNRAIVVKNK